MSLKILKTGDDSDTVFSETFDAHYHSVFGALEESIHVFISAGLYHLTKQGYQEITIFEMGLGTGLNAFLTALEATEFDIKVNYHSIESHPIPVSTAHKLSFPPILNSQNQAIFDSIHSCAWDQPHQITEHFSLTKISGQIEEYSSSPKFDLIYYDAFAPSCQPQLWTEELHQSLYNLLNSKGVLVTYCTQGAFRRSLQAIGYKIERLNGPGKKREMLRATKG